MLKDLPIKRKLVWFIVLTNAVALTITCAGFLVHDLVTFREAALEKLSTLAVVLGQNSTATLTFADPDAAAKTLSSLRAETNILGACIYSTGETLFAEYSRDLLSPAVCPAPPPASGDYTRNDALIVVRPVMLDGEKVGAILIRSDTKRLQRRLERYAGIALLVMLASLLVAFLLSTKLQNLISRPILHLVETAKRVSVEKNYSVRASKLSGDELGLLVDSFNDMLAQIHRRDQLLQSHRSSLEEQVAARTAELSDLNRELVEAKEGAEEAAKSLLAERNQLRTLIDNLPDHVYFKDSQFRFLVNNRAHGELLRARGLQDPIGKTDFDVFSKEEAEAYYADDQAVMRSGKPLVNQREAVSDGDGNHRQLLTTKVPFRNEGGEVAGLVGISRDITKENQLEESRRVMEMQLHQAQKLESIGQLAAGIAHEINTPTQFVSDNTVFLKRAFAGLMEAMNRGRSLLDEAQEGAVSLETTEQATKAFKKAKVDYLVKQVPRALEQSLEGLERVAKLVGAMKEFSHPSQGQKEAVDLAHTIDTTLTVARNEWKYVAEVATDFDSSLPPVPCLRDEFNQVILNMVVNAAQAIAAANGNNQKGTITIQTRLAGEWAEIRVSDTGTGIPLEIQQKVFDPFFTTKEVGKGTGQGLAIARSVVVDKHGGQIDVESEVGKGTTFVIRLPLEESALSQEGKQA